jgi:serine/threonine-protein kinase
MASDRELMAEALPRYEIGEELGRGAWGVVYAAHHESLGRDVAVKALPTAFGDDPDVKRRFRAEAKVIASLHHPHIVAIHDFVEHDNLCLLVMERLDGGTLWSRASGRGISTQDACSAVLATAVALSHAHRLGILHRDVKPQNLLFTADGTLKVTDFGIAKVLGGSQTMATTTGQVLGTPAYISPEQVLGEELTPATDVYALGTILYVLLAGDLPYPSGGSPLALLHAHAYEDPIPLLERAPEVPRPLADCVMQAIARDRLVRHASAEEFGCDLAAATNELWDAGWLGDNGFTVVASGRIAKTLSLPPATSAAPVPTVPPPIDPEATVDLGRIAPPAPPGDPSETVSLTPTPTPAPSPPAPAAASAPVPTTVPARGLLLTVLGVVGLLGSMVLPWFQDGNDLEDTWSGWTFPQGRLAVLLTIATVVLLIGARTSQRLRLGLVVAAGAASAVAVVLVAHRTVAVYIGDDDIVRGPGAWIGLASTFVVLAGAVVSVVEVRRGAPSRLGVRATVWTCLGTAVATLATVFLPWFEDLGSPEATESGWTFFQGRAVALLAVVGAAVAAVRLGRRLRPPARLALAALQVVLAALTVALVVARGLAGTDASFLERADGLFLALGTAGFATAVTVVSLGAEVWGWRRRPRSPASIQTF